MMMVWEYTAEVFGIIIEETRDQGQWRLPLLSFSCLNVRGFNTLGLIY